MVLDVKRALDVKSPRIGKKIKQIPKTTKKHGIRLFMAVHLFMAFGVVFTSLLISPVYAAELYPRKTFEEKVKLFCDQAKFLNPRDFMSMQLNLFLRYKNILILKGDKEKERRYLMAARTIKLQIDQIEGPKLRQTLENQEKKYAAFYPRRDKRNGSNLLCKNVQDWYTCL